MTTSTRTTKVFAFLMALALMISFSFMLSTQKSSAYEKDYFSIGANSSFTSGIVYPKTSDTSDDLTMQIDLANYENVTYQLQYYAPYGVGWTNSGSAYSTSSGHGWHKWTGLTSTYQYRIVVKNSHSYSVSVNSFFFI